MRGGPAVPGVGWGAGIERLEMLIAEPPLPPRPIAMVPIGEAGEGEALTLAEMLRNYGYAVDLGYSGNVGRRMRRANNLNGRAAGLVCEHENARRGVAFRGLDFGQTTDGPVDPSLGQL